MLPPDPQTPRRASLGFALAAALAAAAALYERQWLGFPDGHLTDYDRAWGRLLAAFAWASGAAALWLGGIGITGRRPFRHAAPAAAVLYGLAIACILAFGFFGLSGLDRGQGG